MLKIKDNVDLKELEKYGFVFCDREDFWYSYWFNQDNNLKVEYNDRIVDTYLINEHDYDKIIDLLYDLIKADLVEKVESEE